MQFEFPDVKHVRDVRDGVDWICRQMGIDQQTRMLIVTAVWEATLNAATHGSPNGSSDIVRVAIEGKQGLLHVDVTSRNRDFSISTDGPRLDPASKRGRGLPIIYAFMDEVKLTSDDDGMTLHMLKRIDDHELLSS